MQIDIIAEKKCSKCHRVLPASSYNKAKWLSSGLRSDCRECYSKSKKAKWAAAEPGPNTLRSRELKQLREDGLRRCRVCSAVKPLTDESFAHSGKWWDSTCRACARERVKDWAARNQERAKANAYERCARRYAAKRLRVPRWLTQEHKRQISAVYATARKLTKLTGVPHHVDHIVPLVGKHVSGLHVPWNLQAIPAIENMRKHNTWNSSLEQALVATDFSLGAVGLSGTV